MSLVRRQGGKAIVLSFLVAFMLMAVPLPEWADPWKKRIDACGHHAAVAARLFAVFDPGLEPIPKRQWVVGARQSLTKPRRVTKGKIEPHKHAATRLLF